MTWAVRKDCRLCGCLDLDTVLELEPTPPANEFVKASDPVQEEIPLYLARCRDCGHVQLPVVVDPERLFRNYVYVSGTSPSFVEHFRSYAGECIDKFSMERGDLVVEVGSNDGTMLRFFKEAGMTVLGIDPAKAIAARATQDGIDTWPEFFSRLTIGKIDAVYKQRASLVVANNVFAHADDLKEIALAVKEVLNPDRGRFVFEVQYLISLVEDTLFDMVYHEHLSYHALAPLARFFKTLGMSLVDARRVDTHGGSIRCTVVPLPEKPRVDRLSALLIREAAALVLPTDPWGDMRRRISAAKDALRRFLDEETRSEREVCGYGAPAKLTTLCHQFGVNSGDVHLIFDDSPWKQNMLAPGTRIPVIAPVASYSDKEDHGAIVIFAWNFAKPIYRKLRGAGFAGRIFVPLPEFKEL